MSTWNIDLTHSSINFSVRHMVVSKVRGHFAKFSGALHLDDKELSRTSAEVTIDAASISTNLADRDTHLRSADFLNAERFPALTFKSKRAEKKSEERYRFIGDLTIRDVTKEVSLEVEFGGQTKDPYGNQRLGFTAKTSLERRDFGLTWNMLLETGGLVVGDRIEIELEVEAIKVAEVSSNKAAPMAAR